MIDASCKASNISATGEGMKTITRLKGGRLYDPKHQRNGDIADVWLCDGKVITAPAQFDEHEIHTIDVTGQIVMPGGVDMHCHVVGPKVNAARGMQPSQRFVPYSAPAGVVPGAVATGNLFAAMGYTTVVDAAVSGVQTRLAHLEFANTPHLDKAFLTLLGNHQYILEHLASGSQEKVTEFVQWALSGFGSWGVKIVNPGGVENWKQISRHTDQQFDQPVQGYGVTPRQIVNGIANAVETLQLPHPVHIHCNNLGVTGNWKTTQQTIESLNGLRGHIAHLQFHSYGGDRNDPSTFCSAVPQLLEVLKQNPEISFDVGHILPGQSFSITGDAMFADHLAELTGGRWYSTDVEQESSCGVMPGEFKPYKTLVHAVQWAIGLEWYLMMTDPTRIALTSDHPNGGAFTRYPEMIHLLMSRSLREEMLSRMPAEVASKTNLSQLTREYTLAEIACITRTTPAQLLGMPNKGHLGPGADADVTIYQPNEDITAMFQRPALVLKQGNLIARDGDLVSETAYGKLMSAECLETSIDLPHIEQWFQNNATMSAATYRNAGSMACPTSS